MSIESKMECLQFYRKSAKIMQDINLLINRVPQKGDKSEDCQHATLKQAFNNMYAAINGTVESDFIKD